MECCDQVELEERKKPKPWRALAKGGVESRGGLLGRLRFEDNLLREVSQLGGHVSRVVDLTTGEVLGGVCLMSRLDMSVYYRHAFWRSTGWEPEAPGREEAEPEGLPVDLQTVEESAYLD